MCDDASQTVNTLQPQRGEPEASFTLCCDVDDTQAFERTQLSQFRAHTGKNQHHSSDLSLQHHSKRSRGITSERMDGEGLMGLNNVHLELKINGAAARQRDAASNTAKIKSISFQSCNSDAWKGVCLTVWKNPNWQASQKHRALIIATHHTHTHTFVRAVLPGGQGGKECEGHWWQGNHELELKGSRPPLKAHSWVCVRKIGKKTWEKTVREYKQRDLFKKTQRENDNIKWEKALMVPVCVLCECCDRLEIRKRAVSETLKYFTTILFLPL